MAELKPCSFCGGRPHFENYGTSGKNKISFEERNEVYTQAIRTWGEEAQMVVALEEMSELQKEVCKALRGQPVLEHIAEEIADATIMLEQLRKIFGVNELVCSMMDSKILRMQSRVAEWMTDEWNRRAEGGEKEGR